VGEVRWVKNAKFTIKIMLFAAKIGAGWFYGDMPNRVFHGCQQARTSFEDFNRALIAANFLTGSLSGSILGEPRNGRVLRMP